MITVTILSLSICLLLSFRYTMDYFSLKKLRKILILDRIKLIQLEDIVENGNIKKLSSRTEFLLLIKKCRERLNISSLPELQERLLFNGYFISYPDLEKTIKIMEEKGLIALL